MLVRLREWRQRRGYSVRELAERAAVGFATVHRIEAERISPTIAMLAKLAAALEITVRDLIPVEPRPRRRSKRKRR